MRSPIDGRVVTWNVEDRLRGRPVNRGENLLEIADPTSDWELEVMMPEYRMGHIAKAATSIGRQVAGDVLPGDQSRARSWKARSKKSIAAPKSAAKRATRCWSACRSISRQLREVIGDPKIGATATAKIHCGKRAIGYVWFHDLVDFVRAKILFRLF